jgi:hypothetical protein
MNQALYRKLWPGLGMIGAVIVWRGLKKSEVPAPDVKRSFARNFLRNKDRE